MLSDTGACPRHVGQFKHTLELLLPLHRKDYFTFASTRPSVEVLSRKRKKSAVPNSVSTLTDRIGCVAWTFAVNSWTHTESEMRCDMRKKTPKNARSPVTLLEAEAYEGGSSPLAAATARATSTLASSNALGSAEMQMLLKSTMPTSSASPSCASLAADKSSLATAHEMANVRSPPSDESASVALPLSGNEAMESATGVDLMSVSQADLRFVSSDSAQLSRSGQCAPMRLRRLVLSGAKGAANAATSRGITKRPSAHVLRSIPSFASIFGATLKSVLDFSGVATNQKRQTVNALRSMAQFFGPVSESIGRVGGADSPHLINGLAIHRVCKSQKKHMHEMHPSASHNQSSWFFRSGMKDVAVGVTAAVLVAHFVMSEAGRDADEVCDGLNRCTENARQILKAWSTKTQHQAGIGLPALRAETRALERAAAAARAAARVAAAQGLSRTDSLHLQLNYMRGAAWPAGVACEYAGHGDIVRVLAADGVVAESSSPLDTNEGLNGRFETPAQPIHDTLSAISAASGSSDSDRSSIYSSGSSVWSDGDAGVAVDTAVEAELIDAMRRAHCAHLS